MDKTLKLRNSLRSMMQGGDGRVRPYIAKVRHTDGRIVYEVHDDALESLHVITDTEEQARQLLSIGAILDYDEDSEEYKEIMRTAEEAPVYNDIDE